MNNKVKILTAVVGVVVVGLGVSVSLLQPKGNDLQEPVSVVVDDVDTVEEEPEVVEELEEIGESDTIESVEVAPEPVAVVEVAPEPVAVVKVAPEPVAVVEVTPEPVAVVEVTQVVEPEPTYTGQTYTTVYNGVTYTVTQEQMDRAWVEGAGYMKTDGIPAKVFSLIKNAGATDPLANMTSEEFAYQLANPTVENHGAVVWS